MRACCPCCWCPGTVSETSVTVATRSACISPPRFRGGHAHSRTHSHFAHVRGFRRYQCHSLHRRLESVQLSHSAQCVCATGRRELAARPASRACSTLLRYSCGHCHNCRMLWRAVACCTRVHQTVCSTPGRASAKTRPLRTIAQGGCERRGCKQPYYAEAAADWGPGVLVARTRIVRWLVQPAAAAEPACGAAAASCAVTALLTTSQGYGRCRPQQASPPPVYGWMAREQGQCRWPAPVIRFNMPLDKGLELAPPALRASSPGRRHWFTTKRAGKAGRRHLPALSTADISGTPQPLVSTAIFSRPCIHITRFDSTMPQRRAPTTFWVAQARS
jgi:hypothetical protein